MIVQHDQHGTMLVVSTIPMSKIQSATEVAQRASKAPTMTSEERRIIAMWLRRQANSLISQADEMDRRFIGHGVPKRSPVRRSAR